MERRSTSIFTRRFFSIIYLNLHILFLGVFDMQTILTRREREVFDLLLKNYSTKEIASKLMISEKTVRNHISNVMQKLCSKSRSQAVVELLRMKELNL